MITTVTTVTTVTTIAAIGLSGALCIAGVASLIVLLTSKELAAASNSSSSVRIARFLSIGIVPLIMAFAVIAAVKIAEVL